MLLAAFVLFSVAVMLGAVLLTPALPATGFFRRGVVAALHGAVGGTGLAALAAGLGTARHVADVVMSGAVLVGCGFLAGLTMAGSMWFGRRPHPLVLPLHVIFAGLGYLVLAGLILTQ